VISALREAFVSALGTGLLVGSLITLVGVLAAAFLISGRPAQSARPAVADDAPGTQPAAPGGEAAPAELEPAGV
jgi:hypothetical protein